MTSCLWLTGLLTYTDMELIYSNIIYYIKAYDQDNNVTY